MASDIEQAIRQIVEEKGLSYESVIETIEAALAAAYRKDYGNRMQNIEAKFSPDDGGVRLWDVKTVVEDVPEEELEKMRLKQAKEDASRKAEYASRGYIQKKQEVEKDENSEDEDVITFNPKTEIMMREARILKHDAELGDSIRTELPLSGDFGRMAAMTAKQVITQKLREAEREIVFNDFKEQEGEVLIGTVQRKEGRVLLVDLGRTTGVMLPEDQVRGETYSSGDRIKVYVREVSLGSRGPQILLSRTSEELVKILFDLEIPEINEGLVEIKAIAREAGARTKVAVTCVDDSIDPIGACIGQRGSRIQTIINELGGEKIDVIEWNDDPIIFISNSLSPAKVLSVELNEEEKTALALVDEDQLSLAIGRGGQNVRLAAKLTGWSLSVRSENSQTKNDKEDELKDDQEEEIDVSENNVLDEKEIDSQDEKDEVEIDEEENNEQNEEKENSNSEDDDKDKIDD